MHASDQTNSISLSLFLNESSTSGKDFLSTYAFRQSAFLSSRKPPWFCSLQAYHKELLLKVQAQKTLAAKPETKAPVARPVQTVNQRQRVLVEDESKPTIAAERSDALGNRKLVGEKRKGEKKKAKGRERQ